MENIRYIDHLEAFCKEKYKNESEEYINLLFTTTIAIISAQSEHIGKRMSINKVIEDIIDESSKRLNQ